MAVSCVPGSTRIVEETSPPAPVEARPVLSAQSIARVAAILAASAPPPAIAETTDQPFGVPDLDGVATVDETDLIPPVERVDAPQIPAPAIRPLPYATRWEAQFILAITTAAWESPASSRIPTSVTIAQAILDTGWGTSELGRVHHNYFGIKSAGRNGTAGTVVFPTIEYVNGEPVWQEAVFRAYRTLGDSVVDEHRFLYENGRYRFLIERPLDARSFAVGLQRAGFATDPRFAAKLVALMDRYDLYRYDRR